MLVPSVSDGLITISTTASSDSKVCRMGREVKGE